jgi:hypothetical protein
MNSSRATILLCVLAILAIGASEFRSKAAPDAQRTYRQALQKEKKDYLLTLQHAMGLAGENKDSVEVLKIAEELQRVKNADADQFGTFPASVVGVEWIGSPNMGRVTFKQDGTLVAEKDDQPCRWAAIGADTIISLHSNGCTTVFEFDKERQQVTAYATGQKTGVAWEAGRSR